MGNQTSTILGTTTRDNLTTLQISYARTVGETRLGVRLPMSYELTRIRGFDEDLDGRRWGIGDLSVTGTRTVPTPIGWPQLQLTASGVLPTGRANGATNTALVELSSGNWGLGLEATFQYPLQSGALQASFGYSKYWPVNDQLQESIQELDWAVGYTVDLGDRWQIGTNVSGARLQVGSNLQEPTWFAATAAYHLDKVTVIRPLFAHGMNTDAQDYLILLAVERRW